MTVDVARRRTRRTTKVAPAAAPASPLYAESMSIGEIEQTVFSCPKCQRPLAIGVRTCPGCRTRLIAGVQLGKASAFVAVGLVVGIAVSAVAGGVLALGNGISREAEIAARVAAALAAAEANPVPAATGAPVASSRPLATTPPVGGPTGVPPLARSALAQAATVNAQLAAAVPVLQSALASREFDTYTVFQVLRSVSGNAVSGRQLAAHIGDWSSGAELSGSLAAYYTQIQDTAGEGLDASIRNQPAYKAAAKQMLELLGGLPAIDAQLRTVAADAGVTIPAAEAP
jgi:hypothetical protein